MATYTFYGGTADGDVYSGDANPVLARAGTGAELSLLSGNSQTYFSFGQELAGATYYVYEAFISFDTSSVVGTPVSATLALYVSNDQSATDFTMTARAYDWGTTVTTADFVPAASMTSYSTRATLSTSGITVNAYNSFTSDSSFAANSVSGTLRLLLHTDRNPLGTNPTGKEYVGCHSGDGANPPRLTITTASGTYGRRRPSGLYVR